MFLASALLTAAVPARSAAAQVDLRNLSVFRFDFDNDVLLGKDNSFTAGWSVQVHSHLNDVWGPANAKWIGRVPGLGDGGRGGPIVRWAVGIAPALAVRSFPGPGVSPGPCSEPRLPIAGEAA